MFVRLLWVSPLLRPALPCARGSGRDMGGEEGGRILGQTPAEQQEPDRRRDMPDIVSCKPNPLRLEPKTQHEE